MALVANRNRLKAVLYVRSSVGGVEGLEERVHQERRLLALAEDRGFEVVEVYTDIDGARTWESEGKNLMRLIEDAQKGQFDVILTMSLARLLRDGDFALELRDELMTGEVHLVTLDGLIDTFAGNVHLIGMYDWLYAMVDLREEY